MRPFHVAFAILLAGALALPACNKKDGGPPGPGLDLPADKELIRQSAENLKQIGRGMHAHVDSNGYLPRGIYGPDGTTLGLSWRVALLPEIGEDAPQAVQTR